MLLLMFFRDRFNLISKSGKSCLHTKHLLFIHPFWLPSVRCNTLITQPPLLRTLVACHYSWNKKKKKKGKALNILRSSSSLPLQSQFMLRSYPRGMSHLIFLRILSYLRACTYSVLFLLPLPRPLCSTCSSSPSKYLLIL